MVDDDELLTAWRDGDDAAGERLFERHFDAVVRFFRNKVEEGPEDLVQRTFLGCLEARERFRGQATFRTFLFAIAHNVLKNHFRDRRRGDKQRARDVDFSVDSAFGLIPSPSAVVARHRTQQQLLEALRRIPLQYQIALELHYWEELTAAELAEVVAIPAGTAKTRIRRGKELLLEALLELAGQAGAAFDGSAIDGQVKALRPLVVA